MLLKISGDCKINEAACGKHKYIITILGMHYQRPCTQYASHARPLALSSGRIGVSRKNYFANQLHRKCRGELVKSFSPIKIAHDHDCTMYIPGGDFD